MAYIAGIIVVADGARGMEVPAGVGYVDVVLAVGISTGTTGAHGVVALAGAHVVEDNIHVDP
jgi:hypothetical protein